MVIFPSALETLTHKRRLPGQTEEQRGVPKWVWWGAE